MYLPNLTFSNSSLVYTAQSAYTSMELYYAVIGLFAIFLVASFVIDGQKKPFEKLLSSIIAFALSVFAAYSTFSLALVRVEPAGTIQYVNSTVQAIVPTIIMQNQQALQVVSWIIAVLCFINIINCVMILQDYSRKGGVIS